MVVEQAKDDELYKFCRKRAEAVCHDAMESTGWKGTSRI